MIKSGKIIKNIIILILNIYKLFIRYWCVAYHSFTIFNMDNDTCLALIIPLNIYTLLSIKRLKIHICISNNNSCCKSLKKKIYFLVY